MRLVYETSDSTPRQSNNTPQFVIDDQQDANFLFIYLYQSALHVSAEVFAHYQEHLTVFTASDIVHCVVVGRCHGRDGTDYIRSCKYSQVLLMMGENVGRNM